MKKNKLSLFWKFTIISTVVVIIFGSINIYMLWNSVYNSFENEIDKRCRVLAHIISEKAMNPIVYDNTISLYNILDEVKQSDPDIAYIFITDTNHKVLAKTYNFKIPINLIHFNKLFSDSFNIKVLNAVNFHHSIIRDIAYPIGNGHIGAVRLGLAEDNIRRELVVATKKMLGMMAVFFAIGLVCAFFFSFIITAPIKEISKRVEIIDLKEMELNDDFEFSKKSKFKFMYSFFDELDFLVNRFSDMILRLRNSYMQLKNTQQSLIQAEKMASLGTLSAGVAHEINNPLSGMKNCINRILKKPENYERNIEYLLLVKEAAIKIENVVRSLLNYSRKNESNFEYINLVEVIESTILLSQFNIQKNNISVAKVYDKIDKFFWGNYNQIEQVILNLILNGIDAIVEKQKMIKCLEGVISFIIEESGDNVILKICDNGIGVSGGARSKVFDPFFTSKPPGKGTGLGLFVTYNIIKEHNGKIYLNDVVENGTEFIVELPKKSNSDK